MWTHLLWKDTRQVLPGVAIFVALTVIGQLLSLVNAKSFEESMQYLIGLTLVCPFVVVLFCLGTLIGGERQSRTMHWQSTLPILWYRSFLSKWIVTTAMTVVAFAIVCLITDRTAGGYYYTHLLGFRFEYYATSLIWIILTWIVPLALFSSLFMLLVDEPLYAIGLAAIALIFFYIYTNIIEGVPPRLELPKKITTVAGPWILSFLIVALYRWRWYRGSQSSVFQIPHRVATWIPTIADQLIPTAMQGRSQITRTSVLNFENRPFLSLLAQSCRQAILFRIVVVLAPWILIAILAPQSARTTEPLAFFTYWSTLLLGLSCFTHDHSKQRIRFLSDRGISAWQLYFARTIPTLFAAACLLASVEIYGGYTLKPSLRLLSGISFLCVYFVGQLVGLCLRNVIISIGVALAMISGYLFIGAMIAFGDDRSWQSPFRTSYEDFVRFFVIQVLCVWILTVILVSIFWTIPQWLRSEKNRFGLVIGLVMAGFVSPVLLIGIFTTYAYLSIANQKSIRETPYGAEFHDLERPTRLKLSFIDPESVGGERWMDRWQLGDWRKFNRDSNGLVESAISDQVSEANKWLEILIGDMSSSLEELSIKPNQIDWNSQAILDRWSGMFLTLTKIEIKRRDRNSFDQAIAALVKLAEFNVVIDPVSRMLQQISMMELFNSCTDDDLRWMLESQSLKPLLTEVISLEEYRRWSIMRSLDFEELLANPYTLQESTRIFGTYTKYNLPRVNREKPTNYILYIPFALSTSFIRSSMSREFVTDIEAADELIALNKQATPTTENGLNTYDSLQVYDEARKRNGLPEEPYLPSEVNLADFLRYRVSLQALNDRIDEANKE